MAPPLRINTNTSPDAPRMTTARYTSGGARSDELEKLLNSWGAPSSGSEYDAEAMIDQLLANTWAAPAVRRTSLRTGTSSAVSGNATSTGSFSSSSSSSASRVESFTQQTKSMNELEAVLSDSIDRLLRHRHVISERIAALEKDNQKTASKFQDGLRHPEQLLTQICNQMEDLEERFTKVSSTAVVIGDKLASLDTERTRVLDTDEMLEALLALNDPSSKLSRSNNRLFNTIQDKHQLHEASRVVKKMLVVSTELSSPLISVAVNEIERLSQTIENDLLTEFSDAQERANVKSMRKCAESLIEYNDKEKIADRFVWNVMKDRLANGGQWGAGSLDPIQDLESLFAKIRAICEDQFVVIGDVFPADTCTSIRELLVERLFNDPAFGIFSYLDQFLKQQQQLATPRSAGAATTTHTSSSSTASLEYVRLLCAAYERTCELATQIEALEGLSAGSSTAETTTTPTITTRTTSHARVAPVSSTGTFSPLKEATELVSSSSLEPGAPLGDRARMRAFLTLQLHSLFGSHRQRYFRTELELLQMQCQEIATQVKFPAPVVPIKQKTKAAAAKASEKEKASDKALASSSISSGSSSTNVLPPPTPSSSSLDKDVHLATPGPVAGPATTEAAVLVFYEALQSISQDEDVPAQYTSRMKDALARCDVVLRDSEMRSELITKVFASFIASFSENYLARLVAMTNDLLMEPLVSPNSARQFFTVLEHVLKRIDFMDDQFDRLISPTLTDSPTQLTICYESKRKCMEKLERGVASGLQQVLVVVDKILAQTLATTQDKSDFIGSDTNMSLSCSRACKKCIDFLQPLVAIICRVLMAENRDRFLVALCSIFKELYLQHLQKFRFDPDGACMLLRDVNAYRQIFRGYRHDAIDEIFGILHEVANIFALPPENVGSFIRDGKLATMTKQSLAEILKRRWDYKTQGDKLQMQL